MSEKEAGQLGEHQVEELKMLLERPLGINSKLHSDRELMEATE